MCGLHHLNPELAADSVVTLLNEFRQRMAVNHETLVTRLFPNDKLARRYRIQVNRQVGIPVAFLPPGQKTDERRGYKLLPTWNARGTPTSVQGIWRQFHAEAATPESLDAVLHWMEENGYLALQEIGSRDEKGEGWQVEKDVLEFEAGRTFLRCSVCDRTAANQSPGAPMPALRLQGNDAFLGWSPGRGQSQRPDGTVSVRPTAAPGRTLGGRAG